MTVHLPPEKLSYNDANCSNNYIPSTAEYMQALGLYGIWLLIIGGISTLLLYSVFLEQVFFSQRRAHRVFRRHIYWIASVYPFMTMMSLASVVVPRAHNICTGVKETYMAIGITHFADLTILMYGSEEVMLSVTEGHRVNIRVGPVCCCCLCLPSPKVSKNSIRLTMFLCNQMAFTQAFYYILILILIAAGNLTLGDVNPSSIYLWLSLFNMFAFMSGVWGLQILSKLSNDYLKHYNYNNKSFSMKILVLVTNFQTFILAILGNYDVFPCIPPYISPQVFRQTVENSMYFLEMLLLGCYTYYQYHNREFLTPNPTEVSPEEGRNGNCRSGTVSTTISSDFTQNDEPEWVTTTNQLAVIYEEPTKSYAQPTPPPEKEQKQQQKHVGQDLSTFPVLTLNQDSVKEDFVKGTTSNTTSQLPLVRSGSQTKQQAAGEDVTAEHEFDVLSSSSSSTSV